MSIATEISRISGNITNSLTAVANKGVTVPAGSNSDDLAGLITQIETETLVIEDGANITDMDTYLLIEEGSGGGKNTQHAPGFGRVTQTAYTAVSGQSITVSKTGTYDVYWCGYRSSTGGTNGSCLYVDSSAHSSGNQTSFDSTSTNVQAIHISNVSLTKNQVVSVRARARSTSYYMYVFGLTIVEA